MMNLLKILVTALLIAGILVFATIILLLSPVESFETPSYLVEIDRKNDNMVLPRQDKNINAIINDIPTFSDLPAITQPYPLAANQHRTYIPTRKSHKIAVVLIGLGRQVHILDAVTKGLPGEVSFSFSPYSQDLENKIEQARKYGHETYMDNEVMADVTIDEDFYPTDIEKKIDLATLLAAENGQVTLAAKAKPSVILAIKNWIDTFGDNNIFELVPVNVLAKEQE